jgi:hypothetical protein
MKAAQNAQVFGPKDKAPHALFFACGRYYAYKLLTHLADGGAFVTEERCPAESLKDIEKFNGTLGLEHHNRFPYLKGAWKAKKRPSDGFREQQGLQEQQEGSWINAHKKVPPKRRAHQRMPSPMQPSFLLKCTNTS